MRLLDLFCCAGGAAMGYHRAGFDVVGVDINPQPNYPFEFYQGDALTFLEEHGDEFDAVHGSPPCHDHTSLTSVAGTDGTGWLLDATRKRFEIGNIPWVLENVPGAPMRVDAMLCGKMFGLRTKRHRWFETSFPIVAPPHPRHITRTATKKRRQLWGEGWDMSFTGDIGTFAGPQGLGIDWMTGNELCQAIPPAYTEFVGIQLIEVLSR